MKKFDLLGRKKLFFLLIIFISCINPISLQPSFGYTFNSTQEREKGILSLSTHFLRNIHIEYNVLDNTKIGLGYAYLTDSSPNGPFINASYFYRIDSKHGLGLIGSMLFSFIDLFTGGYNPLLYYNAGINYRFGNAYKNINMRLSYNSSQYGFWYTYVFDVVNGLFFDFETDRLYDETTSEYSVSISTSVPINASRSWFLTSDSHFTRHKLRNQATYFNSIIPAAGFKYTKNWFTVDLGLSYVNIRKKSSKSPDFEMVSPVVRFEFLILKPKEKLN